MGKPECRVRTCHQTWKALDMSSQTYTVSTSDWLRFGGDYLSVAKAAVNVTGSAAPLAHLSWQATENSLKALAVGHSIPMTHDIGKILQHLRDNDMITASEVDHISADLAIVTGSASYNAARYPEH